VVRVPIRTFDVGLRSHWLEAFFQLSSASGSCLCFEHYLDKTTSSSWLLTVHLTEADHTPTVDKQIKEHTKRAQVKGFALAWCPWHGAMYGKGILARKSTKCWAKPWTPIQGEQHQAAHEPLPVPSDVVSTTDKDF
jgi:hypothetical protein